MKEINKDNWNAEVVESDLPVVVDFWAPWCGPCRQVSPVLEEIGDEYQNVVKVVKVNVDENPELSAKFNVMSIPTIIKLVDGEEIAAKVIGAMPKAGLLQNLNIQKA